MTTSDLLDALNWRYATKSFDPARKIPADTIAALEQSLVLTPSSYGLQPWKFLVITDKAIREQLVPHSWGQRQVADCSHFVVFAIQSSFTEADVDRHLANTARIRGLNIDSLKPLREMIVADVVQGPRGKVYQEWAKKQTYIALGQLMLAAATLGVDTCPMEGFAPHKYDEILGLPARGLTVAVACPLGYRSADDKYASVPKVRYPLDEMILRI